MRHKELCQTNSVILKIPTRVVLNKSQNSEHVKLWCMGYHYYTILFHRLRTLDFQVTNKYLMSCDDSRRSCNFVISVVLSLLSKRTLKPYGPVSKMHDKLEETICATILNIRRNDRILQLTLISKSVEAKALE